MLSFRELTSSLHQLDIPPTQPVIVHASLSALGEVRGGADTLLGALLASFQSVVMPTFTYATMVIPETGPPDNGLEYGMGADRNRMAEFFHPDLPADRSMGITAERLRQHPEAGRSSHPILSFSGVNAQGALEAQTHSNPLAPIQALSESQGWVLLFGVDHTTNTGIHLAEKLAGRKQFTRWALTPSGVLECPNFPGCSQGFQAIHDHLDSSTREVEVGLGQIQAIPLESLLETAVELISGDPLALLCNSGSCQRCNAIRERAGQQGA